ncbi:hypothetical protein L596_017450 [Steinernema carpocapsae]|uniref:ABC transmembrane type-1 domain-containing protein n=1 Tax=Steinernema carpocapsae TaxID=34508 RepID=A0A4U5N1Y2_STECR|nr:hypothetical protein L596_017450 [Steinernema carpocapsae]
MAFFDVTPLGRILNRFGKDVEVTDDNLPQYFAEVAFSLLEALTSFIIVLRASIFALPVIAFLMIIYGFVVKFYIRTARQLRRLESVSRSPIYSYFQESIQGVSSIRAYKAMDRFIVEIQRRCDESQKASFHQIVSNMWITIRLEMIGNIIVLAAAMGAVFFRGSVGITAGLVGLACYARREHYAYTQLGRKNDEWL